MTWEGLFLCSDERWICFFWGIINVCKETADIYSREIIKAGPFLTLP